MRVIAGSAKGRRLAGPKSKQIRPVLDQVKEAVFNILFDVAGLKVLDLFAGTGAMGIEALSRGAAYCCFVDVSREAVRLIGKNIDACGFAQQSYVLPTTIGKAADLLAEQHKTFDLVFIDPPYEKFLVKKTLCRLVKSPIVHGQTLFVVEHHPKEHCEPVKGMNLTDQRKYGQTRVSFLQKVPDTC
ncbi:MAG: 16S rRNA (guanine(966)-N(2))-methyltransferase RsmD [Deltaproteobacteria bacterium]|nr:16S rRNA (guanine(966)-N(2))-methyltransferase RsmD [Deltaproteobacteria bacterium]